MRIAARSDVSKVNLVRELACVEAKPKGASQIPVDQLPALLEAVRGDERLQQMDMVALLEFMAGTGVRISEAIGLDWVDVELTAPGGIPTIGATVAVRKSKTDVGVRRIAVPAVVGVRERRDGPVLPAPFLKRRDRRNTTGEWSAARDRLGLGLGPYTFHSFGKTVATALDQAGLSARDIAEYLGHENPSLTMNVDMSKDGGRIGRGERLRRSTPLVLPFKLRPVRVEGIKPGGERVVLYEPLASRAPDALKHVAHCTALAS